VPQTLPHPPSLPQIYIPSGVSERSAVLDMLSSFFQWKKMPLFRLVFRVVLAPPARPLILEPSPENNILQSRQRSEGIEDGVPGRFGNAISVESHQILLLNIFGVPSPSSPGKSSNFKLCAPDLRFPRSLRTLSGDGQCRKLLLPGLRATAL
jgi:hypothetical protein